MNRKFNLLYIELGKNTRIFVGGKNCQLTNTMLCSVCNSPVLEKFCSSAVGMTHSSTQSLYIDSREKGSPQNVYLCTRAVPEVRDGFGGTHFSTIVLIYDRLYSKLTITESPQDNPSLLGPVKLP